MCKYCEFTYVDDEIGEKSNENVSIRKIIDGRYVTELSLNRYKCDNVCNNELILSNSAYVWDNDLPSTVSEEHIQITYCPFCGEKL